MEPLLKVVKAGVFASLQDEGRYGFRRYGIPVSGPMDRVAFRFGHEIVGNGQGCVSLEMFQGGFLFEALCEQTYVLTGADGEYLLNGSAVQCWRTFVMRPGDVLEIRQTRRGQIVYLTAAGGFIEQSKLGSRAAYRPAEFGREMVAGTVLAGEKSVVFTNRRGLYDDFVPAMKKPVIRVFKGPHFHLFDEVSKQHFFNSSYRFQGGNRMGYHLQGEQLKLTEPKNMLSEATFFGTIQVPSSGQPIVLMADAQTVGGYPMIGTVHPDDLRFIAQLNMFEQIRFELVEVG